MASNLETPDISPRQLIYFAGMAVGIATLALLYLCAGSLLDKEDVHASTIVRSRRRGREGRGGEGIGWGALARDRRRRDGPRGRLTARLRRARPRGHRALP